MVQKEVFHYSNVFDDPNKSMSNSIFISITNIDLKMDYRSGKIQLFQFYFSKKKY